MIKKVRIQNFKTLKDLSFPCTRMNLFIGDTSTGKTNILEALTLFSRGVIDSSHRFDQRLIRYDKLEDLFPMHDLSEPMVVDIGTLRFGMFYNHGAFQLEVTERKTAKAKPTPVAQGSAEPTGGLRHDQFQFTTRVRRYEYVADTLFGRNTMKELEPPYGNNLPGLLASNKPLRTNINRLLEPSGMRLKVNLTENVVKMVRKVDDDVEEELPYRSVSDTIKRYLFLYTILSTHKGYTLLFDEPEQNSFPFYVKHTGEMMGFDTENQYFITTHNEYLFRSIVEKTPAKDLSVFITHSGPDGNTRLKRLAGADLAKLLDMEIFFNLDRFIEE